MPSKQRKAEVATSEGNMLKPHQLGKVRSPYIPRIGTEENLGFSIVEAQN